MVGMAEIRIVVPFEDATLTEASDSDLMAAELYRLSAPLVLGVFPALSWADYWSMTTRQHVAFARVAATMNPRLLEACGLTLADLGLDPTSEPERGVEGGEG